MEFGFVLVLFAALFMGVLEFGRIWSAANTLEFAARDGARLAAITDKNDNRTSKVKTRVESSASSYFAAKDVTVNTKTDKGANNEPLVSVSATGKLDLLFGNWLMGKTVTLSRQVIMRDETATPP